MIFFNRKKIKEMQEEINRLYVLSEDLRYDRAEMHDDMASLTFKERSLREQVRELEEDLINTKRKYFEALCLGINNKEK